MKTFLLAAGEGRRLRPLTESLPKCLVPIRGTPLLAIWLQLLENHGITDVLVNVHHFHEQVIAFLRSYATSLAVKTVREPQLLGSAGTVLANRDFVDEDDCFLIVYADNLTTIDLRKMIRFHGARARREVLTLGVVPTDRPSEKGTVTIGADGRVVEFAEKAAQPRSRLANAGIYVANQEMFEYLPQSLPGAGVLDFGYDLLPRMVPRLAAYRIEEFLMDVGTPDAYARAQETWPGLPASTATTVGTRDE